MGLKGLLSAFERILLSKMDSVRESLSDLPFFCHQWEERSFSYKGHAFPVCARCTGVYIGQCVSIVLLVSLWPLSVSHWILIALLIPMGIDWSVQEVFGIESNNVRRFFTGFLGGFGFYGLGLSIIHLFFQFVRF